MMSYFLAKFPVGQCIWTQIGFGPPSFTTRLSSSPLPSSAQFVRQVRITSSRFVISVSKFFKVPRPSSWCAFPLSRQSWLLRLQLPISPSFISWPICFARLLASALHYRVRPVASFLSSSMISPMICFPSNVFCKTADYIVRFFCNDLKR